MMTPAKTIAAQFESLGGGSHNENGWAFGCEFGFWQRSLELEPLGLLRWSSIRSTDLLRGLQTDFAGIEDPAAIELRGNENIREWQYTQTTYRIHADHSGMLRNEVPADQARRKIAATMGFLRDKLIDDLAIGEKLFVYRTYDHIVDPALQDALAAAIGRFGKGVLFYVQHAVDGHLPFTAVRKGPHLIVGYIDRFAPMPGKIDYNNPGWEAVCRAGLAVWAPAEPLYAPSAMDFLARNPADPDAGPETRRGPVPRWRRWLGLSR